MDIEDIFSDPVHADLPNEENLIEIAKSLRDSLDSVKDDEWIVMAKNTIAYFSRLPIEPSVDAMLIILSHSDNVKMPIEFHELIKTDEYLAWFIRVRPRLIELSNKEVEEAFKRHKQ